MNTFGTRLKFTSFGESHGIAIGCVIDGMPSGIKIDEKYLQDELNKRKSGTKLTSKRKESDKAIILSGVYEGFSTGAPIGIIVYNEDCKTKDYDNIKDIFRLAHGDFTYYKKFNIRDHRGGGRSSARESVARVAAGAIANMLLKEFNIQIESGIFGIGKLEIKEKDFDFDFAKNSEIFCLNQKMENLFKNEILKAKKNKDSIGARVFTKIKNLPIGLGEPIYDKLDSKLAHAFIGINGVKAIEFGAGINASKSSGSKNNDVLKNNKFLSNNAGGILAGISNGNDITIKTHFKPTPSIFLEQESMDIYGNNIKYNLKGRHDPCIGIRGSVITTAMARLVIADALLLNTSSSIINIKKVYNN